MPLHLTDRDQTPPTSVIIQRVLPELDCGRYPVKREVGDVLTVSADIFRDGHDKMAAVVKYRRLNDLDWSEAEMTHLGNDRWSGTFLLAENTRYVYTVEAFPDRFTTWQDELTKKAAAGLNVSLELREGALIIQEALERSGLDRPLLEDALDIAGSGLSQATVVSHLLHGNVASAMVRSRSRCGGTTYPRELSVVVDRVRARYASWYELFPRSAGTTPGSSGTFQDVIELIPTIAANGFDVLYFPPIHPIGKVNRKGKNNTVTALPDDPGVPYAIGSDEGGHDAIDPALGTFADFALLVGVAAQQGMEIALDFAVQCAPDHPWVKDHPDWFVIRPDGSIKYAENPPKRYEDIYPVNFDTPDWRNLWQELKRVVLFWVERGVKIFRVDNPHTKPTVFWEWLINEVQEPHPDVIFLAEAFTRPKVMQSLAKAGFTQSYTYFTWRNFRQEIIDYFTELTQSEMAEYYRGNLFPTTPDILPRIIQEGGRPAFKMRLALATTLSSVYGMYSGYELCENNAVPGREEFLNSEKYEYKVWDWDGPRHITPYVRKLNLIRRDHPSLQEYDNLRFYRSDNENIICYAKVLPDHVDPILVVVNLDPFQTHETTIHFLPNDLGMPDNEQYSAQDLVSGETYLWHGGSQYVCLDPLVESAHILTLTRWAQTNYEDVET